MRRNRKKILTMEEPLHSNSSFECLDQAGLNTYSEYHSGGGGGRKVDRFAFA
jgi:hypothetical protein